MVLLLPPRIVPNRMEYKGEKLGITAKAMIKLVATTLAVNPVTARMMALGLSEKTR